MRFVEDSSEILERITDAFFVLDGEWRFAYLNSRAERVLRRPRGELLGKNVWEEFPEAVGSAFYREYRRAVAERTPVRFEGYFPPLARWFEVEAYPSEGRLSVYFRDVTGRKRTEKEIKEYEERLRAVLVRCASDLITILEADGTIRYQSPAAEKVLGYRPEELVGTSVFDHLHPDDTETVRAGLGKLLERTGDCGAVEVRLRHADGSWRHVEGIGDNLLSDPDVRGIVVNSRDVTERRRAEDKIRFQARLLDALGQAVVAVDLPGRITYWNRYAEELYGWSADEAIGRPAGEIMVSEVQQEQAKEIMAKLRAGRSWSGEFVVRRRDGTTFPAMVTDTPVLDEWGNLAGIIGVSMDITERKRIEEALKESEERFRTIFEQSAIGISIATPDRRLLETNRAYREMTGYGEGELYGKLIAEISHPDDVAEDAELNEKLASGEISSYRREKRYVRKDSSLIWVRPLISAVRDEEGAVRFLIGMVEDITERKRAEEKLRKSEASLAEAQRMARLGNWEWDVKSGEVSWSDEVYRIYGFEPKEFVPTFGKLIQEIVHPDDVQRLRRAIDDALHKCRPYDFEHRVVLPDGTQRVVHRRAEVIFDEEGDEPLRMIGTVHDVTERKEAEEELRSGERELAEAQRIAHVGSWSFDVKGNEARWSDEMYRVFGYAPQEFAVTYKGFLEMVHPDDRKLVREAVRETLYGGEDRYSIDYRLVRPDGEVRFLHNEYEAVREGGPGHPVRLVGTSQDVTERKILEEQLEHQALHDSLTGLPNRFLLMDRLTHGLARTKRLGGKVAVLFMDLDNFKFVNDSLGHAAGDKLLVAVSDRLRSCLRPEDTAARLGGDEFAVLLEGIGGASEAKRVAGRVIKELRAPFAPEDGQEIFVTPSIGIAVGGPGDEDQPQALLRRADVAMYRAKEEGKARHRVFDPAMEARVAGRLRLENDLRRALERDEFEVYYQPVVALETGRIFGMEALVRWKHPERGLVLPSEFIPLAEEVGMIVPIGRFVLGRACRQTREWQERYPGAPALIVCVNLSARQLSHPGLIGEVGRALDESGLDPGRLTLEITESAVVGDEERHVGVLRRIEELGVCLAIDDFGTGYSSLSYLKRLPAGMMKIDRSFVKRIGQDPEDEVLVSGMVHVASGLGMSVLAEGVETPEQLARVKELGCHLAQGYHFSEPLPAEAAGELLAARAGRQRRSRQS